MNAWDRSQTGMLYKYIYICVCVCVFVCCQYIIFNLKKILTHAKKCIDKQLNYLYTDECKQSSTPIYVRSEPGAFPVGM